MSKKMDNTIKNLLILIAALLTAIAIMILFNTGDNLKKPNLVSIDSVKQMDCDELHVNFNLCRQHSNTESWGYCATVYLPLYYGKCQYDCVDRLIHNLYYNTKMVPEFNEDIGDTTFEEFKEDLSDDEMLTIIKLMCGKY